MFSMQRKPELLRVFPSFQQAWYPWDSWWGLAWKNPHNPTLYYIILCHITIQTFMPHNPTRLYTHRVLVGVSCGLNGVNRLLRYRCRLQCTLSLEKAVQSGKFRFFQILCHIRIDVQRRGDIRMTQGSRIRNRLIKFGIVRIAFLLNRLFSIICPLTFSI